MGGCFSTNNDDIYSKYTFGPKLGSGGFGQVREVTVKKTGHVRAAKIIVKTENEEASPVNVEEEVEIMKMLHHPNCVKLYDVYEDNLIKYLVMEKCAGGELFEKLEQQVTLMEKDAAGICLQMVRAIEYLHQNDIAHRDLKPENFLFVSREPDSLLKLIDFGLSKRNVSLTGDMTDPCGTLHYVAPEVLRGKYRHIADMWALGVIIFLMLYGYYPYDGEDDEQVMKAIIRREPTWDDVAYELSNAALSFMKKVLCKDPKNRITAEQALQDPWLDPNRPPEKKVIPKNIVAAARRSSVQVSQACMKPAGDLAFRDALIQNTVQHPPVASQRRASTHLFAAEEQSRGRTGRLSGLGGLPGLGPGGNALDLLSGIKENGSGSPSGLGSMPPPGGVVRSDSRSQTAPTRGKVMSEGSLLTTRSIPGADLMLPSFKNTAVVPVVEEENPALLSPKISVLQADNSMRSSGRFTEMEEQDEVPELNGNRFTAFSSGGLTTPQGPVRYSSRVTKNSQARISSVLDKIDQEDDGGDSPPGSLSPSKTSPSPRQLAPANEGGKKRGVHKASSQLSSMNVYNGR